MTVLDVLIHGAKAVAMVLFGLGLGGLLTWADRRQGAMIQDRIGPNRAVMFVPGRLALAAILVPALLVAGLAIWFVTAFPVEGVERASRSQLYSHTALAALWSSALVIAGRVRVRGAVGSFDRFMVGFGDPRRIFLGGLFLHVLVFAGANLFEGTSLGAAITEIGYSSSPALFAFAVVGGASYAAWNLRNEEKVGIRLLGLLHPAADGLKTIFKEDFIPPGADKLMHSLAPFISFFPALVLLAVIPFGDTICLVADRAGDVLGVAMNVPATGACAGPMVKLQVLDVNVGLLYFFAMAGTGIVGAALAGWSSDNKFSLLGGLRAASQMVSYEVTLGLTLISVLMVYGSLRVDNMIAWQAENAWGIFVQPAAFILFFAAAIAETKRTPFDLPEGESEIVAGYFTEYSGMKFAMFFFAEYVAIVTASALMTSLFFGGWLLPFVEPDGIRVALGGDILFEMALPHGLVVLLGVLGFAGKTVLLCWLQLTIRWTLPRFRYDQLMDLCWKKLLPASLVNILITGMVMLLVMGGSEQFQAGLQYVASLTHVAVALVGAGAAIILVLFLLKPASHTRMPDTTSSNYARTMGGTRSARMGA